MKLIQSIPLYLSCRRSVEGGSGKSPGHTCIYVSGPGQPDERQHWKVGRDFIHGAGWVFGSFHTHEKLVRELAY